ncbi:hypothetical protein D3C86_1997390 [compost metagenome]
MPVAGAASGTRTTLSLSARSFLTNSQAPKRATMAKLATSIAHVAFVMVMPEPRRTTKAAPTTRIATSPWRSAEINEMATPRRSSTSLAIM